LSAVNGQEHVTVAVSDSDAFSVASQSHKSDKMLHELCSVRKQTQNAKADEMLFEMPVVVNVIRHKSTIFLYTDTVQSVHCEIV